MFRNKISEIVRTKRALYFKENGWEFFNPIVQGWDYRPHFMQSIVHNLVQLNQFCQQNRIKLYVLEVPRKESVYKQLLSDKYGFDSKEFIKVSQAQENIRKEVRKHHIPYVYPYEALSSAAQQDFVFFKWKHHWTDWGAFVGFRELMKEISKDFPDIPVSSLDDYNKTQSWLIRDEYDRKYNLGWHLYQFFNNEGQDDPPNRALYNYYNHKKGENMVLKIGKFTKDFTYPEGKCKVILIGTSHNENFCQFLPYSAAQTKYIRLNMNQVGEVDQYKVLKLYGKDILAFKPDILILSISTEDLSRLRNLCSIK